MTNFLARYKGECWYLELKGFECDHYFSGLHTCNPSAYGFEKDIRKAFKDYQHMETKATQEEKFQLGYSDFPYFDNEAFKRDLLDGGAYYQLSTGKVVYYYM